MQHQSAAIKEWSYAEKMGKWVFYLLTAVGGIRGGSEIMITKGWSPRLGEMNNLNVSRNKEGERKICQARVVMTTQV